MDGIAGKRDCDYDDLAGRGRFFDFGFGRSSNAVDVWIPSMLTLPKPYHISTIPERGEGERRTGTTDQLVYEIDRVPRREVLGRHSPHHQRLGEQSCELSLEGFDFRSLILERLASLASARSVLSSLIREPEITITSVQCTRREEEEDALHVGIDLDVERLGSLLEPVVLVRLFRCLVSSRLDLLRQLDPLLEPVKDGEVGREFREVISCESLVSTYLDEEDGIKTHLCQERPSTVAASSSPPVRTAGVQVPPVLLVLSFRTCARRRRRIGEGCSARRGRRRGCPVLERRHRWRA